jgi:hypothetical protein
MRTIIFKIDGKIVLLDPFTNQETKINSIRHYLDCPLKLEDGITFGTFFKHIIKDKDVIETVYSETIGGVDVDNIIKEWDKPSTYKGNTDIDYLQIIKIIDHIVYDTNKNGFVDIRVDFNGVGTKYDVEYGLEFIPLNELKRYPLILKDNIKIINHVIDGTGQEINLNGQCTITLFEALSSILYEVMYYTTPEMRESNNETLIDKIKNTSLREILQKQLEKALLEEDYIEAANIKNMLSELIDKK